MRCAQKEKSKKKKAVNRKSTVDLLNKDFKSILIMLKEIKETMFEELKESMRTK